MHAEEPSLLSHLNEARTKALPEGGISTIIYCGRVRSENDLEAALEVHRSIVENEVNSISANKKSMITGILMGQSNSVLHLLEGPCHLLLRILSGLASHEQFLGSAPLQSGSIVYDIEDRPKRFFPGWYSCVLQEQKVPGEELTSENSEDLVFDMASRLLDLGKKISELGSKRELELGRFADKFPTKTLVSGLASSTEYFSLEEFVEYYFDPYHISLDSEQTWPLERLVKY